MIPFLSFALALVFPILVVAAALKDATSYTIPNWISLSLIAAFPPAALAAGLPLAVAGQHLAIGAGALLIGMAMFAFRWIGGGDAKLFAAAALWIGLPAAADYLLVTCLAGGFLALGLMTLRAPTLRPLVVLGPGWAQRLAQPGGDIPYGLAIAAGALAAFPGSPFGPALGL